MRSLASGTVHRLIAMRLVPRLRIVSSRLNDVSRLRASEHEGRHSKLVLFNAAQNARPTKLLFVLTCYFRQERNDIEGQMLGRFQSLSKTVAYRRSHSVTRLCNPATLILMRTITTPIGHVGPPSLTISPTSIKRRSAWRSEEPGQHFEFRVSSVLTYSDLNSLTVITCNVAMPHTPSWLIL